MSLIKEDLAVNMKENVDSGQEGGCTVARRCLCQVSTAGDSSC